METSSQRATAIAILGGLVLALVMLFVVELLQRHDYQLRLPIVVMSYGIVAAILGFSFPEKGWRLGMWLVLFWLLLVLGSTVFSPSIPVNLRRDLANMIDHIMIVIAACGGAAIGSLIARRFGSRASNPN